MLDNISTMKDLHARFLVNRAQHLVNEANRLGFNLTITREPLQPLAMGHVLNVVEVWPSRHPPAPDLRPDGEFGSTEP